MFNDSDCRKQMASFSRLACTFAPKVLSAQTPFIKAQGI